MQIGGFGQIAGSELAGQAKRCVGVSRRYGQRLQKCAPRSRRVIDTQFDETQRNKRVGICRLKSKDTLQQPGGFFEMLFLPGLTPSA